MHYTLINLSWEWNIFLSFLLRIDNSIIIIIIYIKKHLCSTNNLYANSYVANIYIRLTSKDI
jgi:hypothetical protein